MTLRIFGGGIDPAAADPDEEDEVHARKQFVVTGGDRTITDLGVRLERDLVERLDPTLLKTGEERRRLRMHPQQADWADAMYIRAEPTDENRKFDRAVMQYDGYPTVGMPRAWLRNEAVNGIDNLFHTAGPDDHVVVRYLPEGAIEIYPEEVFNTHPEFTRLRAAAPFVVVSSDDSEEVDCFNLAAATPYDGQMFEIVPFDWKMFQFDVRELWDQPRARPTPDKFTRLLTADGVKPCSSRHLHIYWDTEFQSLDEILSSSSEEEISLKLKNTERFRVILPAYGIVHICSFPVDEGDMPMLVHRSFAHRITSSAVEDDDFRLLDWLGITRLNRKYLARINEDWWGCFFEVPEQGPPIIYIPLDYDRFLFPSHEVSHF